MREMFYNRSTFFDRYPPIFGGFTCSILRLHFHPCINDWMTLHQIVTSSPTEALFNNLNKGMFLCEQKNLPNHSAAN